MTKPVRVHFTEGPDGVAQSLRGDGRVLVTNGHISMLDERVCEVLVIDPLRHQGPHWARQGSSSFSILALVAANDLDLLFRTICQGADNYADPKATLEQMIASIVQTAQGESVMHRELALKVARLFREKSPGVHHPNSPSYLQQEILDHLGKGFLLQEVAEAFHLTVSQVRRQLRQLYAKLHALRKN